MKRLRPDVDQQSTARSRTLSESTLNRLSYFSLPNSYFFEIRPNEMMSIPSRYFFMSVKEPVLHAVNQM